MMHWDSSQLTNIDNGDTASALRFRTLCGAEMVCGICLKESRKHLQLLEEKSTMTYNTSAIKVYIYSHPKNQDDSKGNYDYKTLTFSIVALKSCIEIK